MKIFKKEKKDGKREIFLLGKKLFSYKRGDDSRRLERYSKKMSDANFLLSKENDKFCAKNTQVIIKGSSINFFHTGIEIFIDEVYNFSIFDSFIMIDIGLNIGCTSIFFANKENIKTIYAFEPFIETYNQAIENINNNKNAKEKVIHHNFGLSDSDKALDIHYNPNICGSMSSVIDKFKESDKLETISLKKSQNIIGEILAKHSEKVFLKIDCEGAEFEIIPDLDNAGILKKIDIIIIEWHFKNPQELVLILEKNGFIVFCNHKIYNHLGIMRAARRV